MHARAIAYDAARGSVIDAIRILDPLPEGKETPLEELPPGEHRARVASFAALLRDNLAAQGDYRVVTIECPDHPCTATSMSQDVFIAAARKAGARLVVYGGIRKMSTLVQWGEIQLLDLEAEKLLMRRTVTFRGDNDAAYRHAADFVGNTLKETMPKP